MLLQSSDPDIATIYNRIDAKDWILRPEFQRGEVWGPQKKQRLIDTILRNWHVPPIHLVFVPETKKEEVLDGQQRLAAIRDFKEGKIVINGYFPPRKMEMESLDGKSYFQLPEDIKRAFDRYSIRVFTISKYDPEEPGELFFRLNQPTNLTSAEQRNAFFGPVREQIKSIVSFAQDTGVDEQFLGFSNSRMAYDDIFARVASTIQNRTLKTKITSASVAELYRSKQGISGDAYEKLRSAVALLGRIADALAHKNGPRVKLNKATLYTWLCFLVGAREREARGHPLAARVNRR